MMKNIVVFTIFVFSAVLLTACSSTLNYSDYYAYYEKPAYQQEKQELIVYPEIYQPVSLTYNPVDLNTETSIETTTDHYEAKYSDSYTSEWWQYYQGYDSYYLDQYDFELPSSVTYYSYYVPYWLPYQSYSVGQYYPHSNVSIGFGISSFGYPSYSPYHYSAIYDDYYNPFWDNQWASYRYSHYYRAGGFAYLQPYHYGYSPFYFHRPYWGYWGHYSWGYPYVWPYHPIIVIKDSGKREVRLERSTIQSRNRHLMIPEISSQPRDEGETEERSKNLRRSDFWSQSRIPRGNFPARPSHELRYRVPTPGISNPANRLDNVRMPQLSTKRPDFETNSVYPIQPRWGGTQVSPWQNRYDFGNSFSRQSRSYNVEPRQRDVPMISPQRNDSSPSLSPSREISPSRQLSPRR